MTRDTTLQGVILMLAFCVIAPLLDVGAKLAAQINWWLIGLAAFIKMLSS